MNQSFEEISQPFFLRKFSTVIGSQGRDWGPITVEIIIINII